MLIHQELVAEIRERSLGEKLQLLQELAHLIRHEAKDVQEEEDLMMRIVVNVPQVV